MTAGETQAANAQPSESPQAAAVKDPLTLKDKIYVFNLCVTIFAEAVLYAVIAPFLPVVARDKNLTSFETGLIFGIYAFGNLLFTAPSAYLIGIFGAKRCIIAGQVTVGLGSMVFALTTYLPPGHTFLYSAMAIRLVQSAGMALNCVSSKSLLLTKFQSRAAAFYVSTFTKFSCSYSCFTSHREFLSQALFETATMTGTLVGPTIGGLLFDYCGSFAFPVIIPGIITVVASFIQIFVAPSTREFTDD